MKKPSSILTSGHVILSNLLFLGLIPGHIRHTYERGSNFTDAAMVISRDFWMIFSKFTSDSGE